MSSKWGRFTELSRMSYNMFNERHDSAKRRQVWQAKSMQVVKHSAAGHSHPLFKGTSSLPGVLGNLSSERPRKTSTDSTLSEQIINTRDSRRWRRGRNLVLLGTVKESSSRLAVEGKYSRRWIMLNQSWADAGRSENFAAALEVLDGGAEPSPSLEITNGPGPFPQLGSFLCAVFQQTRVNAAEMRWEGNFGGKKIRAVPLKASLGIYYNRSCRERWRRRPSTCCRERRSGNELDFSAGVWARWRSWQRRREVRRPRQQRPYRRMIAAQEGHVGAFRCLNFPPLRRWSSTTTPSAAAGVERSTRRQQRDVHGGIQQGSRPERREVRWWYGEHGARRGLVRYLITGVLRVRVRTRSVSPPAATCSRRSTQRFVSSDAWSTHPLHPSPDRRRCVPRDGNRTAAPTNTVV